MCLNEFSESIYGSRIWWEINETRWRKVIFRLLPVYLDSARDWIKRIHAGGDLVVLGVKRQFWWFTVVLLDSPSKSLSPAMSVVQSQEVLYPCSVKAYLEGASMWLQFELDDDWNKWVVTTPSFSRSWEIPFPFTIHLLYPQISSNYHSGQFSHLYWRQ